MKYKLVENKYNASGIKPSWDIVEIGTGKVFASFYYMLPARNRLITKSKAENYMKQLEEQS